MLSKNIFRKDFKTALEEELTRKNMTIRELAEEAGIPSATIYKINSGERDPRFSTVRAIVNALEPAEEKFIALIAAKFLLDEVGQTHTVEGKTIRVRGYAANTMEECIIAAVRAEKEGARGIICAPILAALIEKLVDIPVVIVKPKSETFIEAFGAMVKHI